MRKRVAKDNEIINAFKEKGWNLYRTTPVFDDLNDIISFGPAKELFYYEKDGTHYFILPIVENPRSSIDIEQKVQELYEKKSLPNLIGVNLENPIAGIAFGKDLITLIENKGKDGKNKAYEVSNRDIIRIIKIRLNKI